MSNTILFILLGIVVALAITVTIIGILAHRRLGTIERNISYQYNLIVKIQSILKSKSATNAVAEHAEMIYQDLLQNLIPILAALDIMPRNTSEHPLWRTVEGSME